MARYTEIEVRWAGRSRMGIAPGGTTEPGRIGGPVPAELESELYELRSLLAGKPHEWAMAPLMRLIVAIELAEAEVVAVQAGSQKLRDLGLAHQAVAGEPGQHGGEAEEILGHAPPEVMLRVRDARIKDERPPIPTWLGPPSQAPDVELTFGAPDADTLADMGVMALHQRLVQLEAGREMAQARWDWVNKYQYGGSYVFTEQAAVAKYGLLWGQTKQAFDDLDVPKAWGPAEIPRRIFDRIAAGEPALASELMSRVPAVVVTEK